MSQHPLDAPFPTARIAPWDVNRIAGETRLTVVTVLAVLKGGGRASSRLAVEDAAKRLGIALTLPPRINA